MLTATFRGSRAGQDVEQCRLSLHGMQRQALQKCQFMDPHVPAPLYLRGFQAIHRLQIGDSTFGSPRISRLADGWLYCETSTVRQMSTTCWREVCRRTARKGTMSVCDWNFYYKLSLAFCFFSFDFDRVIAHHVGGVSKLVEYFLAVGPPEM